MAQFAGPVRSEEETTADTPILDEKCVLHEFDSPISGEKLQFLAYIPPGMDASKPLPALVFLSSRPEGVAAFQALWSARRELGVHGRMLIMPVLEEGLPLETAFAHFAKIMHAARETYPLDADRIALWGYGQGAEQAWHITRCLPDLFAAFVRPEEPAPARINLLRFITRPTVEQTAWIKDDPRIYARNVKHIPLVCCPGTGTLLPTARSWNEVCTALEDLRRPDPSSRRESSFRTERLRFSRSGWVTIQRFLHGYIPAEFEVQLAPAENGKSPLLRCTTYNVQQIHFNLPYEVETLEIDGQSLTIRRSGSLTLSFDGRRWERVEPTAVVVTEKYPDRAGPLKDALLTPLLFVAGTQGDDQILLRRWAEDTAAAWEKTGQGKIRVINDQDVLDNKAFLEQHTLVSFGGPEQNLLAQRLPDAEDPGRRVLEGAIPTVAGLTLRPSPFALDRYVVVAVPASAEAADHPLKLDWQADWVVYDGATDAVLDLGMFTHTWTPEAPPRFPWSGHRGE